ncbi:hypothetical protein [Paenibacillus apiarius]|nr:hypothetical protein [Paenibacillus apiarius]MBN3526771.1 hypothetical protein [Paenibacillus apiarius]
MPGSVYLRGEGSGCSGNLRGRLVRHYDTAGHIQTDSFSLAGMPLH